MRTFSYPWPASAIGPADMALLFHARRRAVMRTTITRLLAEAVRKTYGPVPQPSKGEAGQVIPDTPTQGGLAHAA